MNNDGEKLCANVSEVAKLLGLSRNTAYQAVRSGQIPSVKISKRYLIPKASLQRLLDSADKPKG